MDNTDYFLIIGTIIVIVALAIVLYRWRYPRMKHGEILPADVMKAKYHLTADRYKPPHLDTQKVPEHLRDLLPLAAKWGIDDDIIRDDFQQKASEEEKLELQKSLNGRRQAINEWLDSFGSGIMSQEAAAFMYMMLGLDEMDINVT